MKKKLNCKRKRLFKNFAKAYSECGDTCTNRVTCGLR